jgi:hypothetical protein
MWNLYPDANATYDNNDPLGANQYWLYNAATGARRAATHGPTSVNDLASYAAENPGTGIEGVSGFSTPGISYPALPGNNLTGINAPLMQSILQQTKGLFGTW